MTGERHMDERAIYVYQLNGLWWVDCFVCERTLLTTPRQRRAMHVAMNHVHDNQRVGA